MKQKPNKDVVVIGSGFAGLSAACHLAQAGHSVRLLEKNDSLGGRCRSFGAEGFTFDMGPSWYWMPDVFEAFFARFGKRVGDYYQLVRLDPSYCIHFEDGDVMEVPADLPGLRRMFEAYEPGSSRNLDKFLQEAEYKYQVGMGEFVQKPSLSILEFADVRVLKSLFRLQMLSSISTHIGKLFKNEKLRKMLEFPVLFLGATPEDTPAMYSLMNHADLALGTWYPLGGMHEIIKGMVALAEELGVEFHTGTEVQRLEVRGGRVSRVHTNRGIHEPDIVVGAADYHHVEQRLLDLGHQDYSPRYWDKRTMAPSSLLFYLGVDGKIPGIHHHNLFFDTDFKQHAHEIYTEPRWPEAPLFYVCAPSVTDSSVAPEGCENLFVLIPLAPDLEDSEEMRERYFHIVMDRLEAKWDTDIRNRLLYKKSYAHKDFKSDYHAFKGNAYGLANTLRQTAFLKPRIRSRKVSNLYYAGQLTTPGPGVPPSLISGGVVADVINGN